MGRAFGQHFLRDKNYIRKFVSAVPHGKDVLEIGPGNGALTEFLAEISSSLICVEKDVTLCDKLLSKFAGRKNVRIICADILTLKPCEIPHKNYFVVGNLPFYISSEIIYWLAGFPLWEEAVLSFQKEMAQKILLKKNFERITITANVFFEVKKIFSIPRGAFSHRCSVDVSVLHFSNKKTGISPLKWKKFIDVCFSSKRKKISANISRFSDVEILARSGINENARPQEIPPEKYLILYGDALRILGKFL